MDIFERESYEFSVGDRSFRLEEFTGLERRRYARKLLELHEKTRDVARAELARVQTELDRARREAMGERLPGDPPSDLTVEINLVKIGEAVLGGESDLVVWLLNLCTGERVDEAWVDEHFSGSMKMKLLAKVDEINRMGDHVGNVFSRLSAAQAAMSSSKTTNQNGSMSLIK